MTLTEHFTFEEMTRSDTAKRMGIKNEPSGEQLDNLKSTAEKMELVRSILGDYPISVSSAYRSPELNKSLPGTAKFSAHMQGLAVDFTCHKFGTPRDIVVELAKHMEELQFDKLILEGDMWVHIGFSTGKPLGHVLYAKNPGTANTIYTLMKL